MYSNYFKIETKKSDFPLRMEKLKTYLQNKKVIFYGIGDELAYYLEELKFNSLDIVCISDTNIEAEESYLGIKIISADEIKNLNFDYILIAQDNLVRAEKYLIQNIGIENSKIINLLRTDLFKKEIYKELLSKGKIRTHIKKLIKNLRNKKVIIYGANPLLEAIYELHNLQELNIQAICDMKFINFPQDKFLGYETCSAWEIEKFNPDYILVAEKDNAQDIIEHLYFTALKDTRTSITSFLPINLKQSLQANIIKNTGLGKDERKKKIINNLSIRLFSKPKYSFLPEYKLPNRVRIEACTICQLHCKSCYMRRDGPGVLGYGYLKFNDYKNFIDSNPYIKSVSISNSGEIFLNPELVEIIKYSYEKDITLDAFTGVNLNYLTDEQAEALVKYKFGDIILSIDGASQETYVQYRENGNFDKVIENIKKINRYKEKYNSPFPRMIWKFILFNHNEHEIVLAKEMARDLNINITFSLPWGKNTFTPKNPNFVTQETGLKFASVRNMETTTKKKYALNLCERMFSAPQINFDGKLLGCCILYKECLGVNVFETGLEKALNSAEFLYSIGIIKGMYNPIDASPCTKCNEYDALTFNNTYF